MDSAEWIIVFDDVPREKALSGLNYILSKSRSDLVGTLDDVDDLYVKFENGADETEETPPWFYRPIPHDDYPYHGKNHPCIVLVKEVLQEMGLYDVFTGMCGSMMSTAEEKSISGSKYRWAKQFVAANNILKGIYHICIFPQESEMR